jgi:hypothetical protein
VPRIRRHQKLLRLNFPGWTALCLGIVAGAGALHALLGLSSDTNEFPSGAAELQQESADAEPADQRSESPEKLRKVHQEEE